MLLRYARNLVQYGRIDPIEFYVSHKHRLIYVENAKVACTAIKQALFADVDHSKMGQTEFHETLRAKASFELTPETEEYGCFTVVREPCARFASAFRDKIVREGRDGIFGLKSQRLIFGVLAGINPVGPTIDITTFAKAVSEIPDKYRDRHIASQSAVCQAVTAHPNGRVLKIETLAGDWIELMSEFGVGSLPKLNETSVQKAEPFDPSASWMRYVAKAYADDFHRLDYPVPGA